MTPCKGSFTLIKGTPELAIARDRFALKNPTAAAGGQTEISDGCGRLALRAGEKNSPRPSGLVGLLEELPFICPVLVAVGSTVIIVIKLCKDLPQ